MCFRKVLEKEKQESQKAKSTHQIRQDYVQNLLENISILPTTINTTNNVSSSSLASTATPVTVETFETDTGNEIRIFEKNISSENVITPNIPKEGIHDAIEGFRIEMQRRRRKSNDSDVPTTLILQTDTSHIDNDDKPPASPTTVGSESVIFEDEETMLENAMETMMMLKEMKADQPDQITPQEPHQQSSCTSTTTATASNTTTPTQQSTQPKSVNIVIPDIPKPSSKKKKRQVPEMSLFGKIWTMTDRLTTKATRKYFEELKIQPKVDMAALLRDETDRDETTLMRSQIFSEKILET